MQLKDFIKTTIKYIQDPGHGWLVIPLSVISELGIANKISSCSYYNKNMAYLEEDCDAGVFLEALKEQLNITYKDLFIMEQHQDKYSVIRTYKSFADMPCITELLG